MHHNLNTFKASLISVLQFIYSMIKMKACILATCLAALLNSASALQAIIVGNKENTVANDLPAGRKFFSKSVLHW